MLNEDMILQIFNEGTSGKNGAKGQRVLSNDLVSSIDITNEDKLICIDGNVISEKLFNEYHTKIEMDAGRRSIFSTFCSCADFENNEFKKENYCCKHLVATFYKALDDLARNPLLREDDVEKPSIYKSKSNILSMLLGDEKQKDETKIEVYINKNQWTSDLTAEFKIGLSSMTSSNLYVLKDINHFILACYNNIPISYSKNFTFNVKNQKLSTKDKRLIDFIEMLKTIEGEQRSARRSEERYVDGKNIKIPQYLTREFFEVITKHRVYLNDGFFYRPIDTEILYESPPLDFDLKLIKDTYVLKSSSGMPVPLGSKNDVFLYGSIIYLPDYEFCYKINPYLQIFNEAKVVTMESAQEETILRRLIPNLNSLSPSVVLSKAIKDKIIMAKCEISFYFDQVGKDITLTLRVKYGTFEFNIFEDCDEKIIYRDSKKETQVITVLKNLGFEEIKNKFYFLKGEDYIFKFFKSDIGVLQEMGEVYYSQNFKGIKSLGTKAISGNIKSGKYNYFEMDFKIGDIEPKETTNILRAFRNNIKYYKLKNGEYLDLEELELNKFLKLLDVITPPNSFDNHIEISKGKGVFLDSYLEDNNIRYIKGKKELEEVHDKLKNIEKLNFKEPDDLKGTLRKYQKIGYNWFKTLDYLGFGGILGDEMGLGKTIQAIAFILSNKGSKSLIVAPTSLIYNWISEFEKFAPTLKVAAISGPKDERVEIIKNIEKFDVIITTYNLLKRDLENYATLKFDYCIIDEAQNIKNPHSQNAIAIKEIVAKTKFALSGTPIENSVMDLWSIFDFIMPGYLYDEKMFSVRYHKKLKANPEVLEDLNRLIKPFILRRRKKDVLKELPDKIEKTLMVNLEHQQKKVYKTYANHAMELIKNKVKNDEFKNSKIEILSYITKLRQLCLDPAVLLNDYSGGSAKIEALVEHLHKCVDEQHKVLVFSQFTSVLKNIQKRLRVEGITFSYLDGSIPSKKRMDLVETFNDGEDPVFLISLKAGGTGLNLTSADVVIHFDPWWNPAVEEQATDRAHRIGQKNVVSVIKIIAKGTIEEKILLLQEEKKKLISELMGEEMASGEGFATLSDDEIYGLFEMKE
ncbi:DEAD/DEAH box helicase [Clostridium estertheticum]|uniref:DEAD/DEAH box helicase n=1 Tax=Clostridium estertheticum TaxID=238834 RepID=UPI001C0E1456|nr:SNF2 helicase associated domain-containing protein [Clostridium estertheticum]MBU3075747.1 SNF2 helicase associated domain-containing protein [Clostridium estertheticum]MBU3165765.1 SNF2 helicase associated domain-containing protein [Clostridium estertheticum]MBU3172102.1 SNF2 helicase associated domain-containing protein [Clostridium estertheticum]